MSAALDQARADWAAANDRVWSAEAEVAMAAQATDRAIHIPFEVDPLAVARTGAAERSAVRQWLHAKVARDAAQAAISAAVAAQYAEYGEVDA